jgi:hypothetical protein
MTEFLLWLALRHSDGSNKIYIEKFVEIFKEDYSIDACPNEDKVKFNVELPND